MPDALFDLLTPTVVQLGLELIDVEPVGGVIRVTIDRAGGVDLDTVAAASQAISAVLDMDDPVPGGRYVLEVSSPGLERRLRTPAHFARAVGEALSVRLHPGVEGDRRVAGRLMEADDAGVVVEDDRGDRRRLAYEQIERARTVFEWGPQARPNRGQHTAGASKPAARTRAAASRTQERTEEMERISTS